MDTFSPIYSLLPIGTERFVAGGARHSIIKVFDLRMPGGKLYHAANLESCSGASENGFWDFKSVKRMSCCEHHYKSKSRRHGWNVFLRPKNNTSRHVGESPVYTLSRPSQCSPTFFAGVVRTFRRKSFLLGSKLGSHSLFLPTFCPPPPLSVSNLGPQDKVFKQNSTPTPKPISSNSVFRPLIEQC